MTRLGIAMIGAGGLLMLAACGGPTAPDAKDKTTKVASTSGKTGWNPLDACATLGKDAASRISGSPVTSTELSPVVPGTDTSAAFSMCTFKLANGGQLMLLTRQAPFADATPESIEKSRTADGTLAPTADVPGLGKAALWSDTTKGLQVFIDDTRYLSINYMGLPGGVTGKDQAIAIAKVLL